MGDTNMALTDAALRALKPGDKPRKFADGNGLFIYVAPNGSRLWRYAYRYGGKQKLLSFGAYPEIGLAEARRKRDAARALLREGVDPSAQKKLDKLVKADADAATFSVISSEVLDKKRREQKAERTLDKLRWLYGLAKPQIGERPVASITVLEVLAVLRAVEQTGRFETAKRLRAVIGEVFRYAVTTGRATADPTSALKGALTAPVVKHRAAITDPIAFGGLLRAIDGFQGQPTTIAALKLMALLFPRPGELREAEWAEFDLDKAVWTIPASRTKMRRPHEIPLPPQAITILRDLHVITGQGRLALPGYGISGGEGRKVEQRPISENTMNGALRRLGFSQDEMTAHGFRTSASTLLNESGQFSPDAIERALAHQDPDRVRGAYARGSYWPERIKMMGWWADEIDRLRKGGEVVPMARSRR